MNSSYLREMGNNKADISENHSVKTKNNHMSYNFRDPFKLICFSGIDNILRTYKS
jgi:hypothetical protein